MTFEPYALYHDVIIVIIIFIACIIMCIILYAAKSNQTYIDDDDRIRPRSDYPGTKIAVSHGLSAPICYDGSSGVVYS